MQLNRKNTKKLSNEDVVKAIFWSYLRLDREVADKILALHPEYRGLNTIQLEQTIKKLSYGYLLTVQDVTRILIIHPECITNPELFLEKEKFIREYFNLKELEFGRVLHYNPGIVYQSDELTAEIINNLKTKFNLPLTYIKSILMNSDVFIKLIHENSYSELNTKFELLNEFNITKPDIYNSPAILGNSVNNTLQKLLIASNLGTSPKSYTNGKFFFNKAIAYARMCAVQAGRIEPQDAYLPEFQLRKKYNISSGTLTKIYPWTKSTSEQLWNAFVQNHPECADKVSKILETNQEEME